MANLILGLDFQDTASAAIDAAKQRLEKLGTAADSATSGVTVLDAAVRGVTKSANGLRVSNDDVTKSTRAYEAAVRAAAAATVTLASDTKKNAQNAEANARTLVNMTEKAERLRGVMLAARVAVAEAASGISSLTSAAEAAASAQADLATQMESLRLKFDPLYATSRKYSDTLSQIADAEELGAISAGVAAQAVERLTAAYVKSNTGVDLAIAGQKALAEGMAARAAATQHAADAQEAINRLTGVGQNSDTATRAKDVADYGAALDKLRTEIDPLYASSMRYANGLAKIDELQKVGGISAGVAVRLTGDLTAAYAKLNAGSDLAPNIVAQSAALRSMRAELDPLYATSIRYSDGLAKIEQAQQAGVISAGVAAQAVDRLTAAYAKDNSGADLAAEVDAHSAALRKLRSEIDPLYATSMRYADGLAKIEQAQKTGAISSGVATRLTGDLTAQYEAANSTAQRTVQAHGQMVASSGQLQFAQRQLGVQFVQTISSIVSGQPVLTTFVQQGHQVVDVALATGTGFEVVSSFAKKMASALVSPIGGLALLAAGIGFAIYEATKFDAVNRGISISIRAVGRDAELASSQLDSYAHQLSLNGVSKADSGKIISGLARTPGLSQTAIGQVAGIAPDAAVGLGTDSASAAKAVGEAATGSYAAIKKLDDALNFLTADQRLQIRTMIEHGDKTAAVALVMDDLHKRVDGLRKDSLSPAQTAIEGLSKGWDSFIGSVLNSEATITMIKWLSQALSSVADFVKAGPAQFSSGADASSSSALDALLVERKGAEGLASRAAYLQGLDARIALLKPIVAQDKANEASLRMIAEGAAPNLGTTNVVPPNETGTNGTQGSKANIDKKAVDDATKSLLDQQRVLAAGLPDRARLRAEIAGETEATNLNLDAAGRKLLIQRRVQEALATEIDARGQESAAISRAGQYALNLAAASEQGRAAMLLSTAAAEAHEKAVTQAGVSESSLTREILNRNAAQEAGKGADSVLTLREQVQATKDLITAQKSGTGVLYYAQIDEKIRQATVSLRAARDATTDPAIKEALSKEISQIGEKTRALDDNNRALRLGAALQTGADEIELLKKESSLLFENAGVRTRELTLLKAKQDLQKEGLGIGDQEYDQQLRNTAALVDAQIALNLQKQTISDLSNMATQAFDQVGTAISTAFANGSIKALDFGAVMRSVISSVAQQALKLAVINPILNATLGTSNTTLASAGALLSSNNGSTGSTGASDYLSLGKQIYNQFGGSATNNGTSLLSDVLSTNLISGSITSTAGATAGQTVPLAAADAFASSGGTTAATGGFTLGGAASALGGIGAGFGAGSLIGSLVAGDSPGKQQNSQIGSAVGAAVGAAFGPVGSLIGGLLGGGGGGLIGPPKANHGYSWQYNNSVDGKSIELGSRPYVDPVAQQQFDAEKAQLAAVNAFIAQNNLLVSGATIVGGNNHEPNQPASFAAASNKFAFSSSDSMVNSQLAGKNFGSFDDLQATVTAVKNFEATLPALLDPLAKSATALGSLQTNLNTLSTAQDQVNSIYGAAIGQAQSYGRATDDLSAAQGVATDAITKQSQKLRDQAAQDLSNLEQTYAGRVATANGDPTQGALLAQQVGGQKEVQALSDNLVAVYGDAYKATSEYARVTGELNTALAAERKSIIDNAAARDLAAQQAKEQAAAQAAAQVAAQAAAAAAAAARIVEQEAAAAAAAQAVKVAAVGTAFGAYQTAANAQIATMTTNTAALAALSSSLQQYVTSLDTSSASPLTPEQQLGAARSTFGSDLAAAQGGDLIAGGRLQGDAQTRLANASNFYGAASAQYAAEFNAVKSELTGVATSADTQAKAMARQIDVLNQQVALLARQVGIELQIVQSLDQLSAAVLSAAAAAGTLKAASAVTPTGPTTSATNYAGQIDSGNGGSFTSRADAYLAANPDVAASIAAGNTFGGGSTEESALLHFREFGQKEGRAFANGGFVGNGIWNQDSVLASYAGGGNIALAGGEFVVSAPAAAQYSSILPSINSGGFRGVSNDNGSEGLRAELAALRSQIAALTKITAAGAVAVRDAVQAGTDATTRGPAAQRLRASL